MSALYKSVDETIAAIREQHEAEMKACSDRALACEIETALLREQLAKAIEARTFAERLTTRLLTQFSVVEAVFTDAKKLAMSVEPERPESGTMLPPNEMMESQS